MAEEKTVFRTEDGQEFTDKASAERHEKLVAAKAAYEDARQQYAKALAETQFTADGYPFDLNTRHTYYYVTGLWNGSPEVDSVSFYLWNIDLDEADRLSVVQWDNRGEASRRVSYRIDHLYWHKSGAQEEMIREYAEYVAGVLDRYNELRGEDSDASL